MNISFYINSPTNQQFPILPDDVLDKLREIYSFAYQARVYETQSAVRFCSCWATKEENVEALLADIRAIIKKWRLPVCRQRKKYYYSQLGVRLLLKSLKMD